MEEKYNSSLMSKLPIQFFSEEIDFKISHPELIQEWIKTIITNHNQTIENINYIFCTDEYLLQVNKEHLNHNYYTDIITFDLSDTEKIEADLFISIDRIKDNAATQNISFETELNRVIIHGVLHLIGYNDKTDEQKRIMRKKEDSCLSLLKV